MNRSFEGLLLGRTLAGRYAIEEVIGRGGMSVVYRATDARLGRPVGLKVVSLPSTSAADREEARARLRREAASAARIPPHPNVVQVYDYGTDPELDLDFIVMELLEGEDLKSAMHRRDLSSGESLRILREAARGIAAGHRAGIVHRDVKPANIFLTGRDRLETLKILDFGIAKALESDADDDLTRTGVRPHSPAYASPEQLQADRPVTAASDVYQLGLVGYEILAGTRPFTDEERQRIRRGEHVEVPVRGRWGEVPQEVRGAVSRALEPAPEERFPDAAAFAEALGEVTETAPSPVPARDDADDATLLAEEAIPEVPTGSAPEAGPPIDRSARSSAEGPGKGSARALQAAGAAVLLLLGFWAISRMGGGDEPVDAPEAAALETEELDAEFRPLIAAAAENLWERDSEAAGPEAAEAVDQVILELNDAWVRGDLDRHLSYYADRVDFYNASGASRSRIELERGRALERFPEREITIERTAIEFPEPGRARALVDKSWEFGGDEEEWTGSARQELILELSAGDWRVVAERDVEVYRSERS